MTPKEPFKVGEVVSLPCIAVRNISILPFSNSSFNVGRKLTIDTLNYAVNKGSYILAITQKQAFIENPNKDDLYTTGTVASIRQVVNFSNKRSIMLLHIVGVAPARVKNIDTVNGRKMATVEILNWTDDTENMSKQQKLSYTYAVRKIILQCEKFSTVTKDVNWELVPQLNTTSDIHKYIDDIAKYFNLKQIHKQQLLDEPSALKRLQLLSDHTVNEVKLAELDVQIQMRVNQQIENQHRQATLHEKLKAIQKELGNDENSEEYNEITRKIQALKIDEKYRAKILKDVDRLRIMNPNSAEANVLISYLDCICSLPWGKYKVTNANLENASKILNKNHYGLEDVKDRILEHIAVQIKSQDAISKQVLCLCGPPGVGKTSIIKSIAKATKRELCAVHWGGMQDTSEVQGHRRTYVAAMVGKVMGALQTVKFSNPVFAFDEIDKLAKNSYGDPASALLHVLDPDENKNFVDLYLDIPYDLSQVMFICTANSLHGIPLPLLDRLEVITISGYTEIEKLEIAKRHIIKKEMKAHGLKCNEFQVTDDTIRYIIQNYTKESGVRCLQREIQKLCRKAAKLIVAKEVKKVCISLSNIRKFAGVEKFCDEEICNLPTFGIAHGLAYTEYGGDVLVIEATKVLGKGKTICTGSLGDVLLESAQVAHTVLQSRAEDLQIPLEYFSRFNIHLHLPSGATPKDGPSAGIAILVAMLSTHKQIPVSNEIAMTGEITLRGQVTTIGGLKEKALAAHRNKKIRTMIIPKDNEKDLENIPAIVKDNLVIHLVSNIDEVIEIVFGKSIPSYKSDTAITPVIPHDNYPENVAVI